MTAPILTKGSNLPITSPKAPAGEITVTIEVRSESNLVTDASVLLLGSDGRVRSNDDFVFYNQSEGAGGAVRLLDRGDDTDCVSRDAIRIDLARLPGDVHRIVVGASVDDAEDPFGSAADTTMIVADESATIACFPIDGLTSERALVFGEVYRRDDEWKVRAIGQGYDGGLHALVSEFGVEVDSDEAALDSTEPTPDGSSSRDADHAPGTANVQIKRQRRAPRLPADWRDRPSPFLRAATDSPFHRATLFPAVHSKSSINHEQRATSILLATMEIVREFGRAVLSSVGAPGGRIETFVEPEFSINGAEARPDGLIRVSRGGTTWTALVEVKIGTRRLDAEQVNTYLAVAKAKGFDAVLTITPYLTPIAGDWAVVPDPKLIKNVSLHHLAWEEVISAATIALEHGGVENRERTLLLQQFLTYAVHPSSGMHVFDDMGPHWVRVREAVKTRTISA